MQEPKTIEVDFPRFLDTGISELSDVIYESIPEGTISFALSEEQSIKLIDAIHTYEAKFGQSFSKEKKLMFTTLPDLKERIDDLFDKEGKILVEEIRKNYDKINIWVALDRDDLSDNWFERTVFDVIDWKYKNSEEVDADDILADLSEYIYPDPEDFDDPEEYEEKIEQLERYSERDQHELITKKGARATVNRILKEREEIIEGINNFLEYPVFMLSEDDIIDAILNEARAL